MLIKFGVYLCVAVEVSVFCVHYNYFLILPLLSINQCCFPIMFVQQFFHIAIHVLSSNRVNEFVGREELLHTVTASDFQSSLNLHRIA